MPRAIEPTERGKRTTSLGTKAKERTRRILPAVLACGMWMTMSTLTILENKRTMSELGFPYPMATSGLGMCFSSVACWILRALGTIQHGDLRGKHEATLVAKGALVGALSASSLYFGNVPYLYLSVSFIQMLKSLTPATTLMLMLALKLRKGSSALYLSMWLITIGAVLTGVGEVHANAYGTSLFMLSILSEAGRVVCIQTLLQGYNLGTLETLMYVATASAIFLGLGTLLTEARGLIEGGGVRLVQSHPFHFLYVSSLGFLTNVTTLVVIRVTSPLTLKVVAQLKSVLTILLGVVLYGDVITTVQALGYVLSVGGIVLYNMHVGRATGTESKAS